MENRIRIDAIQLQPDGIRSTQSVADIPGFVASKLYSEFDQIEDYSFANSHLTDSNQTFEQQLHFSPQRANYLRIFDWHAQDNVLEIGCGSGALTYFLAEQQLHVEAIEPNRQLAQLAQLRTRDFPQISIFSEPFLALDFVDRKYDAVILNGITDRVKSLIGDDSINYQQAVKLLLTRCADLLKDSGKIFFAADNRQGLKYVYGATDEHTHQSYYSFKGYKEHQAKHTLNLTQWRALIQELPFEQTQEYYLFPDFRFTNVMLGKEYCRHNQFAFQHLEGISSKDYLQYQSFGMNEILLYQAANAHGHLGDFANSCLFVLSPAKSNLPEQIDFVHLPTFKRQREFISVVKKLASENMIRRQKIFKSGSSDDIQTEPYQSGCQLSVIWRNSIIADHLGIEFQQCLLSYLDYLKKLDNGVYEGMNIDAIANNIIVDEQKNYHLIDREWLDEEQGIDAAFVFYRAIVHFALRNESIFYHFNWVKGISTLGDFVAFCFHAVGLDPHYDDLERMRKNDIAFLSTVLLDSVGYQLTDPFGTTMIDRPIYPTISWCYQTDSYQPGLRSVIKAKADNKVQRLLYCLPTITEQIKSFRFQPFLHLQALEAGYFEVDQLQVVAIDDNDQKRELLHLQTSSDINQANINSAAFYAENESRSHFMFQTHHTFLEFKMPAYELADHEKLQIEIDFRLSPSPDYEIAREKFAFIERQMAEQLRIKDEQFESLSKKHKKLKKQLTEIEASRIWRLLEAYRDTFKISGYPEKNFFGKVRLLVSRFTGSKNKQDKDRYN